MKSWAPSPCLSGSQGAKPAPPDRRRLGIVAFPAGAILASGPAPAFRRRRGPRGDRNQRDEKAGKTPGRRGLQTRGHRNMKREQLAEKILDIKREKGWTWKHVTDEIGGLSPVLVVGALLGQMKLPKPLAEKAASLFGLSEPEKRMLNEVPTRGTPMPPTDPLLYRFYELVMVNGPALKALIEEEFGDGIMSAIDFDLKLDRLPHAKGDHVQLVMSGKFLPYKYYGAEQGVPEYGLREE